MRKKILLVAPFVTQSVRDALQQVGCYSIQQEQDSDCALRTLRWFRPDLVLIDVSGSVSDPRTVAQSLLTDRELRRIPLICFGSAPTPGEFQSAGMVSGYSFLAGPFQVDQLVRAVEHLLCSAV